MPFFIRNTGEKRKRKLKKKVLKGTLKKPVQKSKKSKIEDEEEITSESEIESEEEVIGKEDESESEIEETAQEKRVRLAKQYLSQIEEEESKKVESDDEAGDIVGDRLKRDVQLQSGKHHDLVADQYLEPNPADIRILRGHKLPITCLVITNDNKYIFSASKDCFIIKWDLETGKKLHVIKGGHKLPEKINGHRSHILCLAVSSDGKYLCSGDNDKLIHVWNATTCEWIRTFTGHRDAVSALAFRKGTHQLFSASHDRSVKIWSLDEMAYVETLFGHTSAITAIDSHLRDRAITSGGRDGSIRIWKVLEESQLLFTGHKGSIDCVALINDTNFVSGADDNTLAVWGLLKKKPLLTLQNAHDGPGSENWISALASLQHSDLIASAGSKDGQIKLWKVGADFKSLKHSFSIPMVGFVNSLKFTNNGKYLVAGIGQEHKWGRWWRNKEARNSIAIIQLKKKKV